MPASDVKTERPRLDELDGLRAILALWVVVGHIVCWCGYVDNMVPQAFFITWLHIVGSTSAVETFVILSGFAISFLLNTKTQGYLEFIVGRFFRLYPVYFICLMLGLACNHFLPAIFGLAPWNDSYFFQLNELNYDDEQQDVFAHFLLHLTLLHSAVPGYLLLGTTSSILPTAWSISLEWQYYLLAPLIARLVFSSWGMLLMAVLAYLGMIFSGPWINTQNGFFPNYYPLFLIGILSYHFYDWYCRKGQPKFDRVPLYLSIIIAFGVITGWHTTTLAIWAVAFGSIFARGEDRLSLALAGLRSFLLHRRLQELGRMSYSLYLLHWPLLLTFLYLILSRHAHISRSAMLLLLSLIGLPLILAFTSVLHKYVEIPGMALGKLVIYGRRVPARLIAKPEQIASPNP